MSGNTGPSLPTLSSSAASHDIWKQLIIRTLSPLFLIVNTGTPFSVSYAFEVVLVGPLLAKCMSNSCLSTWGELSPPSNKDTEISQSSDNCIAYVRILYTALFLEQEPWETLWQVFGTRQIKSMFKHKETIHTMFCALKMVIIWQTPRLHVVLVKVFLYNGCMSKLHLLQT